MSLFSQSGRQGRVRGKRPRISLDCERFEERVLLANFTVININATGVGSLRQAILDANTAGTPDTIDFKIPDNGTGIYQIDLTVASGALPSITGQVTIDGRTQAAFLGTAAAVKINGGALASADGLTLAAGSASSVIQGLSIFGFNGNGILVQSNNNTIGGTTAGQGNALYSDSVGVKIEAASSNVLLGNTIGTDSGGANFGGMTRGVLVAGGSLNAIGGTVAGAGNLIGFATIAGVDLDAATSANLVAGNRIGTDASHNNLGNPVGVQVFGATNTVGGTVATAANTIGFAGTAGILLSGAAARNNALQGNRIGTDGAGNRLQVAFGVQATGAGTGNTIGGTAAGAGNTIGAAQSAGISLDAASSPFLIARNTIGPASTLANLIGVLVSNAGNVIGDVAAGNTIGFSQTAGILLSGAGATNNAVRANAIGTDGAAGKRSNLFGVQATGAGTGNTIGGIAAGAGNTIAANQSAGISLDAASAAFLIAGNLIGNNGTTVDLGNPTGILVANASNTIGGTVGNVIGFAQTAGIQLDGDSNTVAGNFVGTNTGKLNLANTTGIIVTGKSNTIGGATGNTVGLNKTGILISGNGATSNVLARNNVGTNSAGDDLGNLYGVQISLSGGNTIGGAGVGNQIDWNTGAGILINGPSPSGNLIVGNLIGTDGSTGRANANGIQILNSDENVIGGAGALANTIGFNTSQGVSVLTGNQNQITRNRYLGGAADSAPATDIVLAPGANGGISTPILASASLDGGNLTIVLSNSSTTSANFDLEIYVNGTSRVFNQTRLNVPLSGNTQTSITVSASGITTTDSILVTATDASSNTSAFSNSVTIGTALVVTNANDSGSGSLRTAIADAITAGGGTITFDIASAASHTITLLTALPIITKPIIINATDGGSPSIILVGASLPGAADGLVLDAGSAGSTIEGFVFSGFGGAAVRVRSSTNSIESNFFGTDLSGKVKGAGTSNIGVAVDSGTGNRIGGSGTSRNVFGFNSVAISLASDDNLVAGNFIGVGEAATRENIANATGVLVTANSASDAVGNTIGGATANLFGFNGTSVLIASTGQHVSVSNNLIGVDGSGGNLGAGTSFGIRVQGNSNTASGNTVDFATSGTAIALEGALNLVTGNKLGTHGVAGSPPTYSNAIDIAVTGSSNVINGANVIGFASTAGIQITGGVTGTVVQGNFIGTDASSSNLTNNIGVQILNGSSNSIGGSAVGQANTIANYVVQGVTVLAGNQNLISQNLYVAGPEPTADIALSPGANSNIAPPIISSASIDADGNLRLSVSQSPFGSQPVTLEVYLVKSGQRTFKFTAPNVTLTTAPTQVTIVNGNVFGLGDTVVVTATEADNDTSAFSNPMVIGTAFLVTSTADNGPNTLRAALFNASLNPGATITFNVSGSGVHLINLITPLPTIAAAIHINGASQPGYTNSPLIILVGQGLAGTPDGLVLETTAKGSSIKGLGFAGFGGAAIHIKSDDNVITANQIGVSAAGISKSGNGVGILVESGTNNVLGGVTAASGNTIGFSSVSGIQLASGSSRTLIENNSIGTDAAGQNLANLNGIVIDQSGGNTVGGIIGGVGNLIGLNLNVGVLLNGNAPAGNLIAGNLIGTDAAGTASLGNRFGVQIVGMDGNTIGGAGAAANTIGFNAQQGVSILTGSENTITQNRYVGGSILTAPSEDIGVGSGANGSIAAPLIGSAALDEAGTTLTLSLSIPGASREVVLEIYVIENASTSRIYRITTQDVTLTGDAALFPIDNSANLIAPTDRILVTATDEFGNTSAFSNLVSIGGALVVSNTNDSGSGSLRSALANAAGNQDAIITFSITTGTQVDGAWVITLDTALPMITSKIVIDGTSQPAYAGSPLVVLVGSRLTSTADGIKLGVDPDDATKTSSGSTIKGLAFTGFAGQAIRVSSSNNHIESNYVGINASGTVNDTIKGTGILIDAGTGNTIGGTTAGAGNVIGGNTTGISLVSDENVLEGNLIGVLIRTGTPTTFADIANGVGVQVLAARNTIGGTIAAAANVIGFATTAGIRLGGDRATGNVVRGNFIGVDSTEANSLANNVGVLIEGAIDNTIGSLKDATDDSGGNTIGNNTSAGVSVTSGSGNRVNGNLFLNANGTPSSVPSFDISLSPGANGSLASPGLQAAAYQSFVLQATASVTPLGTAAPLFELYQIIDDPTTHAPSQRKFLARATGTHIAGFPDNTYDVRFDVTEDLTGKSLLVTSTQDSFVTGSDPHLWSTSPFSNVVIAQAPNVVTTIANDGVGSLHRVIDDYNEPSSIFTTIVFGPAFFASSGVIALTSALPSITREVSLYGGKLGSYDLTVQDWNNVIPFPAEGTSRIIVGLDASEKLHIRIFDSQGVMSDFEESTLPSSQLAAINDLKATLGDTNSPPPPNPTGAQELQIIRQVAAAIGDTSVARITRDTTLEPGDQVSNGLVLGQGSDGSEIAGLSIYGFSKLVIRNAQGEVTRTLWGNGLVVNSSSNTITRSYFGVDPDAPLADNGNHVGILLAGGSSSNTIGGTAVADRVFVAANIEAGIEISNLDGEGKQAASASRDNAIINTTVGTTAFQDKQNNGNKGDGILITGGSTNNTVGGTTEAIDLAGLRVLVSGNGGTGTSSAGIRITGGSSNNIVANALIGTSPTGGPSNANFSNPIGVLLDGAATGNTIGYSGNLNWDATRPFANVISGNTVAGIKLDAVTGNFVLGNHVGSDATGGVAIGNGASVVGEGGIWLHESWGNTIGQDDVTIPGTGSVIRLGNSITDNARDGILLQNTLMPNAAAPYINAVRNNLISRNTLNGIRFEGDLTGIAGFLTVSNNLIGTTADGMSAHDTTTGASQGNGLSGVLLVQSGTGAGSSATAVTIQNNTLSGNGLSGITVQAMDSTGGAGSSNPTALARVSIRGNFIGLNRTGDSVVNGASTNPSMANTTPRPIGNVLDGILIDGMQGVTIGGTSANAFDLSGGAEAVRSTGVNVISGNLGRGIEIRNVPGASEGSLPILIQGNLIGTNVHGEAATAAANAVDEHRAVLGWSVVNTGNLSDGIFLLGTSNVQIVNNLISANRAAGVHAATQTPGEKSATYLSIEGNRIGTNAAGSSIKQTVEIPAAGQVPASSQEVSLGNGSDGIFLDSITGLKTVLSSNGGVNSIAAFVNIGGNLLSGNRANGLDLFQSSWINIQSNYIGTNPDNGALGNSSNGIFINQSSNNVIGAPGSRNVIAGNLASGILISGEGEPGGQSSTGGSAGQGSAAPTASDPSLTAASENLIQDNLIGLGDRPDPRGNLANPNRVSGLVISGGTHNTISSNTVSGNLLYGILLANSANNNSIGANYIGTNSSSNSGLGNTSEGIFLIGGNDSNKSATAIGNRIVQNTISGNQGNGVHLFGENTTANTIQGNFIGTNASGTDRLPNQGSGIYLDSTGKKGATAADANEVIGNVISGNGQHGVFIYAVDPGLDPAAHVYRNVLQGNFIGTNRAGSASIPNNGSGVFIYGSSQNSIGGTNGGSGDLLTAITLGVPRGNLISGNAQAGITIFSPVGSLPTRGNVVRGNFIGTDVTGMAAIPNSDGCGHLQRPRQHDRRRGLREPHLGESLKRHLHREAHRQ